MMNKDKHQGVNGRSRMLQKLVDKMRSGMSHVDAVNEIMQEESPGPPFDLPRRKEITSVLFDTKDARKIINNITPPSKYAVRKPDVWGNAEDGYEINDLSTVGFVEIPAAADEKEIVKILKAGHYLNQKAQPQHLTIESNDEFLIEINRAKDGMPILQLYLEGHL
jgi:hypothetical protein